MAFYQQLEDAVRLSIYAIDQKIKTFKDSNCGDPQNYDEDKLKAYNHLLEDRSRIAIDLAIAGLHCGARYMGDAMTTYNYFYSEGLQIGQSLEDNLIELLAQKRKEIATAQIATHLGADTHAFANYMGNLGRILAIPGTQNVIEHLASGLDEKKYLDLFLKEYNISTIISTVQDKIKTSQLFRESITEWFKDQVGDWNQGEAAMISTIVTGIEEIFKSDNIEKSPQIKKLEHFRDLIEHLKKEKILTVIEDNQIGVDGEVINQLTESSESFIENLFINQAVKDFIDARISASSNNLNWKQIISKRTEIKDFIIKSLQDPELLAQLNHILIHGDFDHTENYIEKLNRAYAAIDYLRSNHQIYSIEAKMLLQHMNGDLTTFIQDQLDIPRKNEFLSELCDAERVVQEGLSKELIEWLLVSQKILLPQIEPSQMIQPVIIEQKNIIEGSRYSNSLRPMISLGVYWAKWGNPKEEFFNSFTDKLNDVDGSIIPDEALQYFFKAILKSQNENSINLEERAEKIFERCPQLNHNTRYRFGNQTKTEDLLQLIFNDMFKKTSLYCIEQAKRLASAEKQINLNFYPAWKKVVWIHLPSVPGKFFGNPLVKIAVTAATLFITYKIGYKAYQATTELATTTIIPLMTRHTPSIIKQVAASVFDLKNYVRENVLLTLLGVWVVRRVILALPEIPHVTATARKINLWTLFWILCNSPQTVGWFLFDTSLNFGKFAWQTSRTISQFFNYISSEAEKEQLSVDKMCAEAMWMEATKEIVQQEREYKSQKDDFLRHI